LSYLDSHRNLICYPQKNRNRSRLLRLTLPAAQH